MYKLNNKIEVLDAIMGSGKTLGIIKWMCDNPNNRYLYVSPMLSEVEERIPTECAELEFTFPTTEVFNTKSEHLLQLLTEGRNIAFTHSLFTSLSKAHLNMVTNWGYVLVVDEEVNLIEPYSGRYKVGDITSLEVAGHIKIDEDNLGSVKWLWEDMDDDTQYTELRRLCEIGMLYCSKRNRDMMVTQLPLTLIQSSRRTIILTYLFKGSVMDSFIKLKGLEVDGFEEVQLIKSTEKILEQARGLIKLGSTPSVDKVKGWSLSSTWYSDTATREQLESVGRALLSVYRKGSKDNLLITLPKNSSLKTINGRRNARSAVHRSIDVDSVFLYCGARATNDYSHKDTVVHAYNRFINVVVKAYLQDYGAEFGAIPDDEQFALSEMVQWIWRSCIRNGESVDVYILSKRMENLLIKWLEGG